MKKHLKSIVALTVICAVVAVILAVSNYITAPIIAKNEAAAVNDSLKVVMPEGEDFKPVDLDKYKLPATVTEAYSEKNGGYAFKLSTSGYSSGMIILCGIDKSGTVTGAVCIASEETLGYEKNYGAELKGAAKDTIDAVDTVAGATKTTSAYKNAVKDALNAFIIIGGGDVDLRDENQIFTDNLSAALPSAQGKFTRMFIAEDVQQIKEIYSADNGTGYVSVVGDSFIAADASGNVTGQDEAQNKALTEEVQKIINSKATEFDTSRFIDIPKNIIKVYKTESRNFIIEMKAAGYGIKGENHASGEYITLKVSVTPWGKIINCETLTQKETEGVGSACADKKFYSQFNGKTEADYKNIDAISGATVTTNGYTEAVGEALKLVKIMEGAA